jgi:hypothetical protein
MAQLKESLKNTNTKDFPSAQLNIMPQRRMGSGNIVPRILTLGTTASFIQLLLNPWGNFPLYPLERRLAGYHSRHGHGDEKTTDCSSGNRTPIFR